MIKWPWKTNELQAEPLDLWLPAISIPLLAPLNDAERQRLINIAGQLLRQNALFPYRS